LGRLDVARETYRENLNDVNELQDSLRSETGLDLTLVNTAKGEFLLQCTKESWNEKDRDVHRLFTSIVSIRFLSPSTFRSKDQLLNLSGTKFVRKRMRKERTYNSLRWNFRNSTHVSRKVSPKYTSSGSFPLSFLILRISGY